MADSFLGIAGVTSRLNSERPRSWRERQFWLEPNGMLSMTALTAVMKQEHTKSTEFNWHSKTLTPYGGAITEVFTDILMTVPYAGGGLKGDTLFVQMTQAVANEFRVGHVGQLRSTEKEHFDVRCAGKVTEVHKNGGASRVTLLLREDDDNATITMSTIADANRLFTIGNINPEAGTIPESLRYRPQRFKNVTGILWDSLKISRSAQNEEYRTGPQYALDKEDCNRQHLLGLEDYLTWSPFCDEDTIGENGLAERSHLGLVPMIETYSPQALDPVPAHWVYNYDPDFAGQSWVTGGWDWLVERCRQFQKWADISECIVMGGSGAMWAVDGLARNWAQMNMQPKDLGFGFMVNQFHCPAGTFNMKTHPRFDQREVDEYSLVFLTPKHLTYRYVDDTFWMNDASADDRTSTASKMDGRVEGFLTECGMEYHYPETFMYLRGVGLDNELPMP